MTISLLTSLTINVSAESDITVLLAESFNSNTTVVETGNWTKKEGNNTGYRVYQTNEIGIGDIGEDGNYHAIGYKHTIKGSFTEFDLTDTENHSKVFTVEYDNMYHYPEKMYNSNGNDMSTYLRNGVEIGSTKITARKASSAGDMYLNATGYNPSDTGTVVSCTNDKWYHIEMKVYYDSGWKKVFYVDDEQKGEPVDVTDGSFSSIVITNADSSKRYVYPDKTGDADATRMWNGIANLNVYTSTNKDFSLSELISEARTIHAEHKKRKSYIDVTNNGSSANPTAKELEGEYTSAMNELVALYQGGYKDYTTAKLLGDEGKIKKAIDAVKKADRDCGNYEYIAKINTAIEKYNLIKPGGYGATDYAPSVVEKVGAAIEAAQKAVNTEGANVAEAVSALEALLNSLEPNGAEIDMDVAAIKVNESAFSTLSGIDSAVVTIPFDYAQYVKDYIIAEGYGEGDLRRIRQVGMTGVLYSDGEPMYNYEKVYDIQSTEDNNIDPIDGKTFSLTFDLSSYENSEKEEMKIKLFFYDISDENAELTTIVHPAIVVGGAYTQKDIALEVGEIESSIKKIYTGETTAKLEFEVKTVENDSITLRVSDNDNVLYINQLPTDERGVAKFTVKVDESEINGNSKLFFYDIYSAATDSFVTEQRYSYQTVGGINEVFEKIYVDETAYQTQAELVAAYQAAWNVLVENAVLLEVNEIKYFEEYAQMTELPEDIIKAVADTSYDATLADDDLASWASFKTDLTSAMASNGLKYLSIKSLLENYLADSFKTDNEKKYNAYTTMTDEQKADFYEVLEQARPFAEVEAFENAFLDKVYGSRYPKGGYLFEPEDYETGANRYNEDYYKIGTGVKTLTSTVALSDSVFLGGQEDLDGGLILGSIDDPNPTVSGKKYDYTTEGPNARLTLNLDFMLDNFVGQGADVRAYIRAYDGDELNKTYPYDTYITGDGELVYVKDQTVTVLYEGLENGKWYNIRIVYKGTDSNTALINKYDLYINGVKVAPDVAATSGSRHKYPCLDTFAVGMPKLATDETAKMFIDNAWVYKSNINAPEPVNNAALLSEIRNVQYLLNNATYGQKAEDYPEDAKAPLETAVASAKIVFEEPTSGETEWNSAITNLKNAAEAFVKNGRAVIGIPFADGDADGEGYAYSITPKISVSRYGNEETVTPIVLVVDKATGNVWKAFTGAPQTFEHDGVARREYTLNPVNVSLASADAPSNYEFKTLIVNTLQNPIPYTYDKSSGEVCENAKLSVKEVYLGNDAELEFTVETIANDNAVITVFDKNEDLIYANQLVTDDRGMAVFRCDVGETANQTLTYYVHSASSKKLTTGKFDHYKATTVNDILKRISKVAPVDGKCDTTTVAAIITEVTDEIDNVEALGFRGGLYDLYLADTSNRIVPAEAADAVWKLTRQAGNIDYTKASELDKIQEVFLQNAQQQAMNYLPADKLAEILNNTSEVSLTDKIGIGAAETETISAEDVYRYNKYLTMTTKADIYSFIINHRPYADYAAQKKVFNDAVLLALVNNAPNNDTITDAIDNCTDMLTNGTTYKGSKSTVKSAAAGFIKSHASFTSLAELDSYIPTALEEGAGSLEGSGGDGSSGGGGSGGGGRDNLVTESTITGQLTPGAQTPDLNTPMQGVSGISKMPFTDLAGYDWADAAISVMYSKGVLQGKSEKIFAPADDVTREEFVKMAVMLFGISAVSGECHFADVAKEAWYRPYIIAAVQGGIINGISDTMFGSGQNITREQLAVVAYNAAKAAGVVFKDNTFYVPFADDENVSDYAKAAVEALAASGVINGKGNNIFAPKDFCTRAEAAKVLYGVFMLSYV